MNQKASRICQIGMSDIALRKEILEFFRMRTIAQMLFPNLQNLTQTLS